MNDLIVKTCVVCKTEKSIDNSFNNYRECKTCNNKRLLKRCFIIKDKIF